ncbi:MAG TPA: TylF/MycF/NovP-related O-methyltransferase [Candidatus Saccharimonadaceae bacterium]|nr:TylF/MycF/NovP-related O-methyltransferase [Candidatus Saccharimonadaceae bacterium]
MKLLSDQVTEREITTITRELRDILASTIEGDVVEFGCYVGTTSVFLAKLLTDSTRALWLYDSFEGLPGKSAYDLSPVGEQFMPGELSATRKQLERNLRPYHATRVHIKKGWFSELRDRDVPQKISFAFLDGDYYHSIRDSLERIWPRLSLGATIVVDDYVNEALPGASRAVDEWAKTYHIDVRSEQSLAIFHKNT